ncbi:MAG: M61 family metallopeptidase [Paraglaciecola sp.]|nr:M61 family metallopeptidase [Paraglaciecola sp.]NCT48140.1 M61 family metallopeptidase [Paraglaciecola sp.]
MRTFPAAIHYQLSLDSIAGHLFTITLNIDKGAHDGQVLRLPAWIPGSYMIRDFAKHIVNLRAQTAHGQPLTVEKIDKQSWRIAPSADPLQVEYSVYAYDLSVRGAYINDLYSFFNGTNVFLEVLGQSHQPCTLSITAPTAYGQDWQLATAMPTYAKHANQQNQEFKVKNYDELIDHPVIFGRFDKTTFTVDGLEFELILAGGHRCDTQRIVKDLRGICQQHLTFFGKPAPVQHYVFITLLTDAAFGGLEHRASTALMFARNDLPSKHEPSEPSAAYRNFLSLCSHEFFHTWLVKRIRPLELAHGDLSQECYTEQLWIYEGFTSYYDDLLVLRSGSMSMANYLDTLAHNLTRLQRNPGRYKQTVAESSFDAWTRFYQQNESAINNIVSYYTKGAILALCLDLSIRLKSAHQYSLDDLVKQLWLQFGCQDTATPSSVINDLLNTHFSIDLKAFLQQAVYSTEELPVADLLAQFGVTYQLRGRVDNQDKGGVNQNRTAAVDLSCQFKPRETGIEINQVTEDSAAYRAGLMVGDIIIALDGWQVSASNVFQLLEHYETGQTVMMYVLRDKRFITLNFVISVARKDTVVLTVSDETLAKGWLLNQL